MLPYKDQKSANIVHKDLTDFSRKINADISPVYTSRKVKDELKVRKDKLPLVSQQYVVYPFQCVLCDAGYVGYTNALKNTKDQQLKTTSESSTIYMEPKDRTEFSNLKKVSEQI